MPSSLTELVISTVIISASGALAPGPLTFGAIIYGTRMGWQAGIWMAVGHSIVEYPLILALAAGVTVVEDSPILGALRVAAALFIAYLGIDSIINRRVEHGRGGEPSRHPVVAGAALTGLNPFFILWWASVGIVLIPGYTSVLGWLGPHALFAAHVWMDYAWLGAMAALGEGAIRLVGSRGMAALRAVLGVAMLYIALGLLGLLPLF